MSALRLLRPERYPSLEDRERELALERRREERRATWRRWRRRLRSWWCVARNGRHELYKKYDDSRICQQCLLCGHETSGWEIDRRDRRGVRPFAK